MDPRLTETCNTPAELALQTNHILKTNESGEENLKTYEVNNSGIIRTQPLQDTNTYKSFCRLVLRTLNLCLASFYFGYTLSYMATFPFSSLIRLYDITSNQDVIQGLLQGTVTIGAGVGALCSSILLKVFSRRNAVLFISLVAIIFGIVTLFPSLYLYFVARFFQGMCIGMYSAVTPLLIKQYSPTKVAGILGPFNQILIFLGFVISFGFQLLLSTSSDDPLTYWRYIYGLTLITIVLQSLLLIFVFNEQTPKYLLLNNREEDCIKYLQTIYHPQYVQDELNVLKKDLNLPNGQNYQLKNINELIIPPSATASALLSPLSSPETTASQNDPGKKYRIAAALHLAVLQQFSGINAVSIYVVDILVQVVPNLSKVIPVILNVEGMIGSVIATFVLIKFGRKVILQVGTAFALLTMIFIGVGYAIINSQKSASNGLIITGLIIYNLCYGISLGSVIWLYIPEIVSPEVIPFSTLLNWTAASIVVILFPIITKALGNSAGIFFFFVVWLAVSLVVNQFLLIQTKDKTETQIRQQYRKR